MNIFKFLRLKVANALASENLLNKAIYSFMPNFFFALTSTKKTYVNEGYKNNITVYALVKLIGGKAANAKLFAVDTKGEPLPKTDIINKVLIKPNEMQRQQQFIEAFASWLLLTGDVYIYKLRYLTGKDKGKVYKMYFLPAQYVQITGGGWLDPVKEYRLIIGDQSVAFPKEDITHVKYFNPSYDISGTQLYGQSPLEAALKTIQSSNEGTNAKIKAFINGGVAGLLSSGDANAPLAVEQIDQVNDKIREKLTGSNNAHRISATSGFIQYTKIGESPADLEILKSLQFDSNQLCTIFGVDSVLFDNSSSSYNNKKEAKKALINDVVIPLLNLMKDALDEVFEGSEIEYSVAHFPELQEDLKEQVLALKDAYWMSLNEKRAIMKLEPFNDENADSLLIPNNYTPINEISLSMDADLNNIDYNDGTED